MERTKKKKLIFGCCVGYFDRAYYGFWGEPNMTAVELRRHTNTVYSLNVCVGQQRSSPGRMLVLLTSYMHHDDVCSLALRQTLGTTNNMFHTCVLAEVGPTKVIQSCCIRVTNGALDPNAHRTSHLRLPGGIRALRPDPQSLILQTERRWERLELKMI